MEEDLISVVVPVYNVEKYLRKCVDSIINQTYKNLEIILVDDGSPDNCGKICDEYEKKDNRVKVIHKENGGLSDARNVGTRNAIGKYLTYIDSDDFVSSDYIDVMYQSIRNNPKIKFATIGVKIIRDDSQIEKQKNNEMILLNDEQAFLSLLYNEGVFLSAWGKLFETNFIKKYEFPVGKAYEDTAVIYKWIYDAKKIIYCSKKGYFYVNRKNSISTQNVFNEKELDYMNHTKKMLEFIKKNYSNLNDATDRFFLYANFRELRILLQSKNPNKQYIQEVWNNIKQYRKIVIKNKRIPKRDKFAIYTSYFGKEIFKLVWMIYCKVTNRVV